MRFKKRATGLSLVLFSLVYLMLVGCSEQTATPTLAPSPTATATAIVPTATVASPAATEVTPPSPTQCQERMNVNAGAGLESKSAFSLPAIKGIQEVQLEPTFAAALAGQVPQVNGQVTRLYVSDSEMEQLASSADQSITAAGYRFSLPCQRRPIRQGDFIVGFYSKNSAPDILLAIYAVANENTEPVLLETGGVSPTAIAQYQSQVKGKKSVLVVYAAPGLLKALVTRVSLELNLPDVP